MQTFPKYENCVAQMMKSLAAIKDQVINAEDLTVYKEDSMFNVWNPKVNREHPQITVDHLVVNLEHAVTSYCCQVRPRTEIKILNLEV